jgi:hypothetical protein
MSAPAAWTSLLQRESTRFSPMRDLCRDWHRWSRAERFAAVAAMLTAVAISAAVFLGAPLV